MIASLSTSPTVRRRAFARCAPLVCVVAAFASSCSTRQTPEAENADEIVVAQPDQVSRGFALTQTDRGRLQWELRAVSGEIYEGGDLIDLTDLAVDFYDSTATKEGTLSGRRGKVHRKENVMEVEGNVVLVSADGSKLTTSRLVWSNKDNRITTDAYVEIERKRSKLSGYGLVATPDLTTAEVQREVRLEGERGED
ncbi:MAG: LPS export ABC transporter periplasmic protein LptC [bacterium]